MNDGAITLHDAEGHRIEAMLLAQRADGGLTARGSDGRTVHVPAAAVDRSEGRDLHLKVRWSDLEDEPWTDAEAGAVASSASRETDADAPRVIPLVEERLDVTRQRHATGTVRVHTRTEVRDEDVEAVLTRETVDVERVPVDRLVDAPLPVREEGDRTIVPLHEEVLVVEKRLLLREELHLMKRAEDRTESRQVRLKREEADIERKDSDEA